MIVVNVDSPYFETLDGRRLNVLTARIDKEVDFFKMKEEEGYKICYLYSMDELIGGKIQYRACFE